MAGSLSIMLSGFANTNLMEVILMTNNYGIALNYTDTGCKIFYGERQQVLDLLVNTADRVYGYFFPSEKAMILQLAYFVKEKGDNATIESIA